MNGARRASIIVGVLLIAGGLLLGVGYEINMVGEGTPPGLD